MQLRNVRDLHLKIADNLKDGEIEIFENAILYSGVIVSYGVKIGKNVKVGAGSLVYRSIEENAFYSGVPARLIHRIT